MKSYSNGMKFWRAINFPLVYLGMQVVVSGIVSFVFAFLYILANMPQPMEKMYTPEFQNEMISAMGPVIIWSTLISAIISGFIFILIFRKDKRENNEYHAKPNLFIIACTVFFGFVLQIMISAILTLIDVNSIAPEYVELINSIFSGNIIVIIIAVGIIVPIVEELCFRGIVFNRLKRDLALWPAVVIQAVIFGVAHLNIVQGLYAAFLGMIFGLLYYKFKNILVPIVAHIAVNSSNFVMPYIFNSEEAFVNNAWIIILVSAFVSAILGYVYMKYHCPLVEIPENITVVENITNNTDEGLNSNLYSAFNDENQGIGYVENMADNQNKRTHTPSLVLMIIGLVFAILLPLVTYPCSIISLVMSISKKKEYKTKLLIILNIVALVIAIVNSVLGVLNYLGYIHLY